VVLRDGVDEPPRRGGNGTCAAAQRQAGVVLRPRGGGNDPKDDGSDATRHGLALSQNN
jgi:hypothetical protein